MPISPCDWVQERVLGLCRLDPVLEDVLLIGVIPLELHTSLYIQLYGRVGCKRDATPFQSERCLASRSGSG
jgi:hypothetical protein